jgi:hypothetical protein
MTPGAIYCRGMQDIFPGDAVNVNVASRGGCISAVVVFNVSHGDVNLAHNGHSVAPKVKFSACHWVAIAAAPPVGAAARTAT